MKEPALSITRRAALATGLGAVAWLTTACGDRARTMTLPGEHAFGGLTMGTSYTVKIAAPRLSDAGRAAVRTAVDDALAEVVALMSHYDAESELSRLNRQPVGQPLQVSAATWAVLDLAQSVRRASEGAFDVSLGLAVDAWGFGPTLRPHRVPDADLLRDLLRPPHEDALALDSNAGTVTRLAPLHANLSGIAKGFGVERAAQALKRLGIGDFMVEVGGEIRTLGRNAQRQPWRLAIERPDAMPQRALFIVPLEEKALATSGDYRNFFMHEGRRLSHEIDPATAAPVRHALASVSVVAGDCTLADAWSTALFVLGPKRGFDIACDEGLAAYFVLRRADGSFGTMQTPAFDALGGSFVA
ncbi:MAG: FAD:protein FMN transferase [Rubrivivax sp.]